MRNVFSNIFIVVFIIFAVPMLVIGQVRESNNYKIERDSLNVGGGFGTSSNFQLEDTVGEVGTGESQSDNYSILAGYQQSLEETYISISSPSDISMDSINGLIGGFSTSSAQWTVTTNNNAGYSLSIKAANDPAMFSALDYFNDYTPATADPDFDFSIDSSAAEFGFNPSGGDIINKFKDNGSACNIGSSDGLYTCWDGLSTTSASVAQGSSANDPSGTITTINFRAESGSNKILTAGSYSATITMTAIAL